MANARAGRLHENRRIGKRWEDVVASARRSSSVELYREVYVIPLNENGLPLTKSNGEPLRTRIDIVKRRRGTSRLLECKNGPCAPLTVNQKQAFPAIEKNGYILQSRRLGLQQGTVCPPTKVEVIRPENGAVWKPACWGGADLDNASTTDDAGGEYCGSDAGEEYFLWDFESLPSNKHEWLDLGTHSNKVKADLGPTPTLGKSWNCLHQ
mmetsp:Transcript_4787/g.8229  ORF Transcript_4787/g.8229 Transcript_4787/m.8229 type:complete len:209 (+) Transcript_4787:64-690(+)